MNVDDPTRRSFLGKLLAGTLLAGLAGTIGSLIAYLFPAKEASSALGPRRTKVARAERFAVDDGKLVMVEDQPVWVIRSAEGFLAMSAWCTHKRCVVRWQKERRLFSCPCHEGEFDKRGNVISGLPLRPLAHFRVGLVDGDLYVSHGEQRHG
jgi:Rieske Fe-S protein